MKQRQKYLASLSAVSQQRILITLGLLTEGHRDTLDIKQLQ
jgi:hypothetical protein